jgi:hypothetical protein
MRSRPRAVMACGPVPFRSPRPGLRRPAEAARTSLVQPSCPSCRSTRTRCAWSVLAGHGDVATTWTVTNDAFRASAACPALSSSRPVESVLASAAHRRSAAPDRTGAVRHSPAGSSPAPRHLAGWRAAAAESGNGPGWYRQEVFPFSGTARQRGTARRCRPWEPSALRGSDPPSRRRARRRRASVAGAAPAKCLRRRPVRRGGTASARRPRRTGPCPPRACPSGSQGRAPARSGCRPSAATPPRRAPGRSRRAAGGAHRRGARRRVPLRVGGGRNVAAAAGCRRIRLRRDAGRHGPKRPRTGLAARMTLEDVLDPARGRR